MQTADKLNMGPLQSHGHSGDVEIDDRIYHYASKAEKWWLEMVAPGLRTGSVLRLDWQPEPLPLTYRYCKQECKDVYRPDAHIIWDGGEDWWIEIKRGALHQKAASKLKRACKQYPDYDFVMVWYGSMPKRGVAKKRLDGLRPHLHHIWQEKKR